MAQKLLYISMNFNIENLSKEALEILKRAKLNQLLSDEDVKIEEPVKEN